MFVAHRLCGRTTEYLPPLLIAQASEERYSKRVADVVGLDLGNLPRALL